MDFLFPKICVGCGVWETCWCDECRDRLETAEQICPVCTEPSIMGWTHTKCRKLRVMDGLIAIFDYEEPVMRAVIDAVKYGFNKSLIREVLRDFRFETGESFDLVVPVPLHFYRENWRGFNQAEEISKVISEQLGIQVAGALRRWRKTEQQARLKTTTERERNVAGAFEMSREWRDRVRNKKILLVDDVFTSGADMRECTRILKGSGARLVWGVALAR